MKKVLVGINIVIGCIIGIFLLIVSFYLMVGVAMFVELEKRDRYETTDIANYGKVVGNNSNKMAEEFLDSFMPPTIEDYFSDIQYSYKAEEGDAYAFEIYLEFVIEDEIRYEEFIKSYTSEFEKKVFDYDETFTEYVDIDIFMPGASFNQREGINHKDVNISKAKIKKILCCDDEQRIIFIVLGVYDGGLADTNFLSVYFDRFNINPMEYQRYEVRSE